MFLFIFEWNFLLINSSFAPTKLTMTLYVALFFTATKRTNQIKSLVLLRIHMWQGRGFLRLVHWIKIWIWSMLLVRPLQAPHPLQYPRVLLVRWLLHPRALWILLFLPLKKKKKRPLLSSREFWKRLAVQVDKSLWLCVLHKQGNKSIQTDPLLLPIQTDPRLLRMEPKFPSLPMEARLRIQKRKLELSKYCIFAWQPLRQKYVDTWVTTS